MAPVGAIIMGIFAVRHDGADAVGIHDVALAAGPPVLTGGLSVVGRCGTGAVPASERPSRVGRIIGRSAAGEGVGIFLAVNIVMNLGRPDLVLPAIALVIGLHFPPMAYANPFRLFYATGASLLLVAIGFALPQPAATVVTIVAAALMLWTASYLALGTQPPMRMR